MANPMRRVDSALVDGFTEQYLQVFAGENGAGGAPHLYKVFDAKGKELCEIRLQEGHPGEIGVNGIGNQTLLLIVLDFLQSISKGEFHCRENSIQITKIEEALLWSKAREIDRRKRNVYQTYNK